MHQECGALPHSFGVTQDLNGERGWGEGADFRWKGKEVLGAGRYYTQIEGRGREGTPSPTYGRGGRITQRRREGRRDHGEKSELCRYP